MYYYDEMSEAATLSARRKPKGDKRDRTRAALLEAARALIRERGYARTTLEEVAQRAGMTTGAIYGNFKNRDELFIALGQTYWKPVRPRVKSGATFAEMMRAMAEATLEAIPERAPAAVGRLTGLAYTLTHADLRARVQELTEASYKMGAEWLRTLTDERELPMPPEQLVCVIHALTEGLVMQRILTPALCPDEVFFAAFAALANPRRDA
ncbi:MAG TPA: TetR/AcrR family transcriptional regulator [Vicinamibacterales bacterium]|nr:TetR/AcrR family transcriptional regulator [Vicinamibacterales bacterium]